MRPTPAFRLAALLCLAVLAVAVGVHPLSNNDIWLHLTTGRAIVDQGEVPHTDDYSFTRAGAPYVAHEWLAQVFFWCLYRVAGVTGLIMFKPVTLMVTGLLLWRAASLLGADPVASVWAAVVGIWSMTSHLFVRPHLFTFMLLAAATCLLAVLRTGNRRALGMFAGVQLLWANLHGGFILGIALALSGLSIIAAGLGALVAFANPNGAGLYRFVLIFTEPVFRQRIREWASPFREPFFGSLHFWIYATVLILTIAAIIHHARRRRWVAVGPLLLFAALSFSSKRNVSLLGIVAAPWLAVAATEFFTSRSRPKRSAVFPPASAATCIAILTLAGAAALFGVPHETGRARRMGLGLGENLPVAALDYIEERGLSGRVFNSLGFGAYITWRQWPATRVFIDSRLDVYGGEFLEQYGRSMSDPALMKDLLRRYDADYALISYRLEEATGAVAALSDDPDWALVHYDDIALVYVKREPRWSALLAQDEYRHTNPAKFLAGDLAFSGHAEEALSETGRALTRAPGSALIRLMRGAAYSALDRDREAVSSFEEAAQHLDTDAGGRDLLYGFLGTSYMKMGDDSRAEAAFAEMIRLSPGSVYGRQMLEEIRARRKRN